ncbi:hypothetical protein HAX54_002015 [Datura stramonium]|uniref:Uncharacterized protein n=1 Tax=Datura stramonium TaxID=4076 RepID=A0ABS8T496_DATST|nr:hypothetical protein [Datura stramonium]
MVKWGENKVRVMSGGYYSVFDRRKRKEAGVQVGGGTAGGQWREERCGKETEKWWFTGEGEKRWREVREGPKGSAATVVRRPRRLKIVVRGEEDKERVEGGGGCLLRKRENGEKIV